MVQLRYYNKKFFLKKYQYKSVEENVYSQLIKLTFLNGKKSKMGNKFNLSFLLFKLNFKKLKLKSKLTGKKIKFRLHKFLKTFLIKSKLKYKFRFKRVSGVYHEIPEFKNPKQEALWTLKLFVRYINIHRYLYSFVNKLPMELMDFFTNKSFFKKLKNNEDKIALDNKYYTRYLRFITKYQIRHGTNLFKLRLLRVQPLYRNIQYLFRYKFFREFKFRQKFLFLKHKLFLYYNRFKFNYKLILSLIKIKKKIYKKKYKKKYKKLTFKKMSIFYKYLYLKNFDKNKNEKNNKLITN